MKNIDTEMDKVVMEKIAVEWGKALEVIESIEDDKLMDGMLKLHYALREAPTVAEKLTLIEAQVANVLVLAGIKPHQHDKP